MIFGCDPQICTIVSRKQISYELSRSLQRALGVKRLSTFKLAKIMDLVTRLKLSLPRRPLGLTISWYSILTSDSVIVMKEHLEVGPNQVNPETMVGRTPILVIHSLIDGQVAVCFAISVGYSERLTTGV